MATCKFTPWLTIKKADLPVTCKLQSPPSGLTIAPPVEMFDANGTATDLTVSTDGQSFVIPSSIAAGVWTLGVRVQGGPNPIPPIHIVEDCSGSQPILTIADPLSKAAIQQLTVVRQ